MKTLLKSLILLCLVLAMLMSAAGCGIPGFDGGQSEKQESTDNSSAVSSTGKPAGVINAFTMSYDHDSSLNPYSCEDKYNLLITQLMFEGLFVLNDNFETENLLCSSWETQDGKVFEINVTESIKFSDGSNLKAIDVAYSINEARMSGKYARRLENIESCVEADEYTVRITLSSTNYQLPKLLDVPIVAYGTGNDEIPVGTGAYKFVSSSGKYTLEPSELYHGTAPSQVITLSKLNTSFAEAFSSGALDLTVDDVCSGNDIAFSGNFEMHYYNTTVLQYVGFNMNDYFMSDSGIRSGIAAIIDRDKIVSEVMQNRAVASPLIFSPEYCLYDDSWEKQLPTGVEVLSGTMYSMGMEDIDNDGILELTRSDDNSAGVEFTIDFIVNEENPYKVEAAEMIALSLQRLGVGVNLRVLAWDDFTKALENGDFDMYYGEVYLSADFDFTDLLTYHGRHNYGDISNSEYSELIENYLEADSAAAQQQAAKELSQLVQDNNPVVPVLYRKYAAVIQRNKVSGADPTQSSIFYGIENWKIN